ncbi:MAG: amidohydrolase family protein, partial [Candidatus Binataceae bacterium]
MEHLRMMSADSHVIEPLNFWTDRVDRKFRDNAPRVIKLENGRLALVAPGIPIASVTQGFARGKSGQELKEHLKSGYEAAPAGGWDPVERLKDQDTDGVEAEVLHTTQGMRLFILPDAELQRACFRAYNDWLAEFCSHNPARFLGIGLLSVADVKLAAAELEHCARIGLRGAMLTVLPPEDRPYGHRMYDPLWAAASELAMPLTLHAATGSKVTIKLDPQTGGLSTNSGSFVEHAAFLHHEVQHSLVSIIFNGVFDRFPELKIISVENGVGWMPYFIDRLDYLQNKYGWMSETPLQYKASDYMRRHVMATFQDDPVVGATYHLLGADNYMWASDFPHADSTWPDSRKVIERDFAGVPIEVTRKIVYRNAAR